MEIIRSESIPFEINLTAVMERLHVRPGTDDAKEFEHMVVEAKKLANPRYVYTQAFLQEKGNDYIVMEDIRFDSRVLRVNLDRTERTFPFVCTCGMELQEWGSRFDDMVMMYWAEMIKEEALRCALDAYFAHLSTRYRTGHVSTMSPGSLANWPISQQAPLFKLLGNPPEVLLTESMLMVPTKSVSGIVFPTDASFESCQLCPRETCPNRRAPYDESLYEREYCLAVK